MGHSEEQHQKKILQLEKTIEKLKKEVNDLKTIENELKESKRIAEELSHAKDTIIQTIPGVTFTCEIDQDWTMVYLNKEIENLSGYKASEFLNRKIAFADIMHPDDTLITDKLVEEAILRKEHYVIEYRLIRKDGTYRFVYEQGKAEYDQEGKPIVLHGTILDITERKEAEGRFQGILESAPDSMVVVDQQFKILFINAQTEKLFGYKREELEGKDLHILIPHRYRSNHGNHISNFFLAPKIRQMGSGMELWALRKDGSEFPVEISLSPLKTKEGLIVSAAIRDITQRKKEEFEIKKAKEEAEAGTRAKGEFLANMSHEIRTPMNAILGLNHLLLNTSLDPKQKDYAVKIKFAAEGLLGIINDILDFSKVEAGKLEIEKVSFNLEDQLVKVLEMIAIKAEKKGLELVFGIDGNVPRNIIGDPHRLHQVILNLINNAIKFTLEGEIIVRCKVIEREDNILTLLFSISDTGIGMNQHQMDKLFKSFTQADMSTSRKYGGTGLGLSISKKLVELMGGGIQVKSEEGVGSVFSFTIKCEAEHELFGEDLSIPNKLKGLNVMVVDDHISTIHVFEEYLKHFQFNLTSFTESVEALKHLKEQSNEGFSYDLLIFDCKMPHLNGIELAEETLHLKKSSPSEIILMSGYYKIDEIKTQAEELGIRTFLTKPVSQSILFDTIMTTLMDSQYDIIQLKSEEVKGEMLVNQLNGIKILLVEDNEINQQIAREILEIRGAHVTIAENGLVGVEKMKAYEYDIILMDLQMPVMDGYQAAILIREMGHTEIPIIAMTADAMKGVQDMVFKVGMDDYISKPIDVDLLYQKLDEWFEIDRASLKDKIKKIPQSERKQVSRQFLLNDKINFEEGLIRLGNNEELYDKLLYNFISDLQLMNHEIHLHYQNDEFHSLKNEAHKLKGVAGNLSISIIYSIAKKIDQLLSEPDDLNKSKLFLLLEDLKVQSLTVSALIQSFLQQKSKRNPQEEHQTNEYDAKEFEEIKNKLLKALTNYEAEAKNYFEDLKKVLISTNHQKLSHQIEEAINSYDFEKAISLINEIET